MFPQPTAVWRCKTCNISTTNNPRCSVLQNSKTIQPVSSNQEIYLSSMAVSIELKWTCAVSIQAKTKMEKALLLNMALCPRSLALTRAINPRMILVLSRIWAEETHLHLLKQEWSKKKRLQLLFSYLLLIQLQELLRAVFWCSI